MTIIYVLWALIPLFFFLLALWSFLEKTGGKKKSERPGDLLRQGIFVALCVVVCIVIGIYLLPSLIESFFGNVVPTIVFQIVLLPIVLALGAMIYGPTRDIKIEKPPEIKKPRGSKGFK